MATITLNGKKIISSITTNTNVNGHGTLRVTGDATANVTVDNAGVTVTIAGNADGRALHVIGGTLVLNHDDIDGSYQISNGGTLRFVRNVDEDTGRITLSGANNKLILGTARHPPGQTTATIVNAGTGDAVELGGIAFRSGVLIGSTLTFFSGPNGTGKVVYAIRHFELAPGVVDPKIVFGRDGTTGLDYLSINTPPCFAAGTRIRTTAGDVAVEALRVGGRAVLRDGALGDVIWIGHRTVDIAAHPRPDLVAPVTIRADAIAAGVPSRDVVLSPDHAVFLYGKLIQARQLINGQSVTQDLDCPRVTYYHVELAAHAALLAEGLPVESYLDTGNRGAFANAGQPLALHPVFGRDPTPDAPGAFAPLTTDAAEARPIWERIAIRTGAHAIATTNDPELRIVVDGRAIGPTRVEGGRYVFTVPAEAMSFRLVSRAASPAETQPWLDDRRVLGVAVARIVRHGEYGASVIEAGDADLSRGWHDAEAGFRWTDGDAQVALRPGTHTVAIYVHATATYPAIDQLARAA